MRKAYNALKLDNMVFTRLLVIRRVENSKNGQSRWLCRCDCGEEVVVNGSRLKSGHTKSCGCYAISLNTKHGKYKTSEYVIYQQMKERCYNKKKAAYARYGARGITVCDRWLGEGGFTRFYGDMGPKPNGMTLDRIDNDGPYSPENCRWADAHTQYTNRRQTVWLEFNGETLCRKDWARRTGLDEATIAQRISRGWSVEKALTTKPMNKGSGGARWRKTQSLEPRFIGV